MKIKWIPFILVCGIAVLIIGMRLGATSEHEFIQGRQPGQRGRISTIAVVNADIGVLVDGARSNYSAAIIDTLGEGFVLVSPAMAQTGLANDLYSAIVTFPSDVSMRILSFNAHQPERINLDFQINPNLNEREFLETYVSITGLQLAINTTLANTYVSSIIQQFHEAQDQVGMVFQNDLSHLSALDLIVLEPV